jgi:hypothetical protein
MRPTVRMANYAPTVKCTLSKCWLTMLNGGPKPAKEISLSLELTTLLVPSAKTNSLSLVDIILLTSVSMMYTSLSYQNTNGKNLPTKRVEPNLKTLKVKSVHLSLERTIHVTTMLVRCTCSVDMVDVDIKGVLSMTCMCLTVTHLNGPKCKK